MSYFLKQSSSGKPLLFLMTLASDHVSPATGVTPTVTLSKSGATFAAPSGAVSEVGSGWYAVAGDAGDSDTLGPLLLHAEEDSADPTDVIFRVVAFDPDNAVALGLSALPDAAAGAVGGLPLSVSATGQVDVKSVAGAAQTARDIGASVLLSNGTGTGQVSLSAGKVAAKLAAADVTGDLPANAAQWGGVAVTGMPMPTFTYTAPDNANIGAIKAKTDTLPTFPANFGTLAINGSGQVTYSNAAPPGAAAIADAIAFPDPLANDVPGAYTAGQAGYILGTNLDAKITSRSTFAGGAVASVTADVGITQAAADKVWSSAVRTLTSFGALATSVATAVWSAGIRTLSAFGFSVAVADKTGYSAEATNLPADYLSADQNAALAHLDADVSSRMRGEDYTAPLDYTEVLTAIKSVTDKFSFTSGDVNASATVSLSDDQAAALAALASALAGVTAGAGETGGLALTESVQPIEINSTTPDVIEIKSQGAN